LSYCTIVRLASEILLTYNTMLITITTYRESPLIKVVNSSVAPRIMSWKPNWFKWNRLS